MSNATLEIEDRDWFQTLPDISSLCAPAWAYVTVKGFILWNNLSWCELVKSLCVHTRMVEGQRIFPREGRWSMARSPPHPPIPSPNESKRPLLNSVISHWVQLDHGRLFGLIFTEWLQMDMLEWVNIQELLCWVKRRGKLARNSVAGKTKKGKKPEHFLSLSLVSSSPYSASDWWQYYCTACCAA